VCPEVYLAGAEAALEGDTLTDWMLLNWQICGVTGMYTLLGSRFLIRRSSAVGQFLTGLDLVNASNLWVDKRS